ncbi:hypothetical protein DFH27DRAFT_241610 [Peziza echinospora]|nr:hypothetical protein DFH27DRAFT_241610 [Peziza echinospora]
MSPRDALIMHARESLCHPMLLHVSAERYPDVPGRRECPPRKSSRSGPCHLPWLPAGVVSGSRRVHILHAYACIYVHALAIGCVWGPAVGMGAVELEGTSTTALAAIVSIGLQPRVLEGDGIRLPANVSPRASFCAGNCWAPSTGDKSHTYG